MYEIIAFYLFSSIILALFYIVVTTKQPVFAITALASGLIFIGGLFFLLDAEFLGVIQIAVYSGGIMALYAFGFMFFDASKDIEERTSANKLPFVLFVLVCVILNFLLISPKIALPKPIVEIDTNITNAHQLGLELFSKYLLAFELAAILLLVAMIGGIMLLSSKMDKSWTTTPDDEIKADS
ncbi:MAG: NADH-ubiquinone oxidoreductase chain J (EC [uncultured Campylobacterales bacterium]|uniref:NADH-quinone oxidoreductase subunit J n=1 Tax=uncultured Campylobacterales bacterium TaxID=352960 RepID=A0A6S6SD97_9BACT|nr:MAG: NADH-ubiquinone oxidoreductase chain J (EC [uncultured Campylobacterales bacterium]